MTRAHNEITPVGDPDWRACGNHAKAGGGRLLSPANRQLDRRGGDLRVFMLPDADHPEASPPKREVGLVITLSVRADLLPPKGRIRLRCDGVVRAPMPETAIDEDRDSRSREHHIDV